MKAIVVHETGGPEVMRLEEVPVPEPKAGEVRLKVEAVGVNFVDVYRRVGLYPIPLPSTPGSEAAGVVDALGPDVAELKVGDRVASAALPSAYAEYAVAPAQVLVPLPDDVETRTGAAVMLQGMTAHYLAYSTFPLKPRDVALVHAAAGGVGQLLVQIAKRRGARVIGTVSTEEKARLAREAGADEVIYYTQQDFAAEARRLTDGRGVDVVYDSVGQTTYEKSLDALRPRGYLVLYGQSSGPVPPFNLQTLNAKGSLYVTRPTLVHYTATRAELLARAQDLFSWIAAGALKVRVDQTFPLAEAPAAHRYLEGRQTRGKVLLIP
jgi:NADPH2:quinone reductase